MAKVKLGALAAQVSGSIGGDTWSHNRFGNYVRLRSIPVQPESPRQLQRRAALSAFSSSWGALSATIRLNWKVWAQNNPIVDVLGDKRILTGHMAYVALNARLAIVALPAITNPPVVPSPPALTSLTVTANVAEQAAHFAFGVSPLAATYGLYIWAAKTPTPSINYIKNLLRWTTITVAAQTTPWADGGIALVTGAFTLNETLITRVGVIDHATGQISTFREARCTITATP